MPRFVGRFGQGCIDLVELGVSRFEDKVFEIWRTKTVKETLVTHGKDVLEL